MIPKLYPKPKIDQAKLFKKHETAMKVKSSRFISGSELKDLNLNLDIQANRVVDLTEVKEAVRGIIILPPIMKARVIYSEFYPKEVNDIVEGERFWNLQNLLKEAEQIIQKLYPNPSHEQQALTNFMQNYEVIPEFVDIFADVHSKITKRDKANRSIPQQQSTTVNQNNKKVRKVLKILFERLVLEKTVKELSTKYGVRDSKICKIVQKFISDPLSICNDNQSAQHTTRRKLQSHHIEYLKHLLDDQKSQKLTLMRMRSELLNRFPDLKNINKSTIFRVIKQRLGYSYLKEIYINKRTNFDDIKKYWFYYYKCLFEYLKEGCLIISIDEVGFSQDELKHKSWAKTGVPNNKIEPDSDVNFNMIVAISTQGICGFLIRFGAFNQFAFAYFLDKLVTDLERKSNIRKEKWVFVFDNAGFHTSYLMLHTLMKQKIRVLFTAPYHPGCDPVEHFFADLKLAVRSKCPSNRNEVITNCLEAMQAIQVKGTHSYFKRTLAYYSDAYNMNNI